MYKADEKRFDNLSFGVTGDIPARVQEITYFTTQIKPGGNGRRSPSMSIKSISISMTTPGAPPLSYHKWY